MTDAERTLRAEMDRAGEVAEEARTMERGQREVYRETRDRTAEAELAVRRALRDLDVAREEEEAARSTLVDLRAERAEREDAEEEAYTALRSYLLREDGK